MNVTEKTSLSWSKLCNRAFWLFFSPDAGKLHQLTWTRGKQVNLTHLVSYGRCIMWRAAYLHTELHEQKGNRQVKGSDFTLQRPHLDSFVQDIDKLQQMEWRAISTVKGWECLMHKKRMRFVSVWRRIKGEWKSTFTTYMGTKEKMQLGIVRVAQWQSQVAARGILSGSK